MYYFISDIHLGYFDRETDKIREDKLLAFLDKIGKDCETLYILGDLFDYWFEYKTVIPKYFYRTLSALRSLREKGINVEYLIGNHDFGHRDFFPKEIGINVYWDDIERTIAGKRFYLSHGDGKSNNDMGYRILKKILRSKFNQWLYFKIHPDCGIPMASSSSQKSRAYTDKKNFGKTEGMEEFAQLKLNEGFDYVVMGHRHRPIIAELDGGRYINLGDWLSNYTFGTFDGSEFKLLNVNEFIE